MGHRDYERACVAALVGVSMTALFEASERARELKLDELGSQLIDRYLELSDLRRKLLDLPAQLPDEQQSLDVPF